MLELLILALAFHPGLALELVSHSRSPRTGMEGEAGRLSCRADSTWRWCYWQNGETGERFQSYQAS